MHMPFYRCPSICTRILFQFAWAAVTEYHRLGGFNNRNVRPTVLEPSSPRSGCGQVWLLPRPSWACRLLHSPHVLIWPFLVRSPPRCLCVSTSSYKDTSLVGPGPTLSASFLVNHLFRDSASKYSHILGIRAELGGTQFSP